MLNFTVGPVTSGEDILSIGAEQTPYFRTPEFSAVMLENERLMKKFTNAGDGARAIFITGSGTASMEAAVINSFTEKDRVLVINGGAFGQRFADICRICGIPHEEVRLGRGKSLKEEVLYAYGRKGFTGLLVNAHATSTCVRYDIDMIGRFCKENGIFLIVDAVSSFLADKFDMAATGTDIMLTGSQKALACPPGISVAVLSADAVRRARSGEVKSLYFNFKNALKDAERGQTPFTPAVTILLQVNARLKAIEAAGGTDCEYRKVREIAEDFREKIKGLPLEITSESLSNAATPLHPLNVPAYGIFTALKDEYGIWVCPNGGELKDRIFRVGHMGALTKEDNTTLTDALKDLQKRGML